MTVLCEHNVIANFNFLTPQYNYSATFIYILDITLLLPYSGELHAVHLMYPTEKF